MRVFAISDLHLALAKDKPMDVFGPDWEVYMQNIKTKWQKTVFHEDLVLIPGDLSWATYLDDAEPDFSYIEALPGKKIITKGNHDYWWTTQKKLDKYLEIKNFSTITFLQNRACFYDNVAITGTRGWKSPEDEGFTQHDERIYLREMERLKLSLQSTSGFNGDIITMLHFPPYTSKGNPTGFVEIMQQFNVSICIYGHLHGKQCNNAIEGEQDGIRYYLVSSDYLQFMPLMLGVW
ncbi:MAG: serine/threonine protein phosphatase [Thermoanaerobacterales bacterium]|nr:serine/threonine protein phosphatase [Thermoanaerobacterales bacterium]